MSCPLYINQNGAQIFLYEKAWAWVWEEGPVWQRGSQPYGGGHRKSLSSWGLSEALLPEGGRSWELDGDMQLVPHFPSMTQWLSSIGVWERHRKPGSALGL